MDKDLRTIEQEDLNKMVLAEARQGNLDAAIQPLFGLPEDDERNRERLDRALITAIVETVGLAENDGHLGDLEVALRALALASAKANARGVVLLLAELANRDLDGRMPQSVSKAMGSVFEAIAALRPEVLGNGQWAKLIELRPEMALLATRAMLGYGAGSVVGLLKMFKYIKEQDVSMVLDEVVKRIPVDEVSGTLSSKDRKELKALLGDRHKTYAKAIKEPTQVEDENDDNVEDE